MIKVIFPDGNQKEYNEGVSLNEIAKSISPSLAKKCIAGKVDGVLANLNDPINNDCAIQLITTTDEEAFNILNHSSAHLLAQAVRHFYPEAKFGVGPAIEEGFYYDIDVETPISEFDLQKIENQMKKLAKQSYEFTNRVVSYEEAKELFKNDEYKQYLIDKINANGEQITVYTQGDFTDLCRGIHVDTTAKIKHVKLLNVAGAYWLGDSNNKMLQRIYGTSWFTAQELEDHLQMLVNRREYDHRKLGKELEIFTTTLETGAGLPLWLPNGAIIRNELERFIKDEELRRGYKHVYTPVLGTKQLYETSGHWDHYQDDMFAPIEMDKETFVLRPMCCPHHAMIFKHAPRSYKELPYRVAELGGMHRYEASGALTGLERVRFMCLNDAHLFVRPDQIKEEFKAVIDLIHYAVEVLELDIHAYRLSLRDPNNKEKYFDNDEMWNTAESMLRDVLVDAGLNFTEAEDEAAFYGPKLDIQIKTALGHEVTLSTVQLDFLMPERFDLSFIGPDGDMHRPVVIHRGIISTMERMTATLLEQYRGVFPTWLSPAQVNIIPVSNAVHSEYAQKISQLLIQENVRVSIDDRNEKLPKKIREAQIAKVPYTLILGDNEQAENTVTVRPYSVEQNVTLPAEEFVAKILLEIKSRSASRTIS